MQPSPHYGDPSTANAHAAADGSRVISLFVFNTDVHLHAYAPDGADPADPAVAAELDGALAACRDRCLYFERRLSRTRPDSDISRAHAASPDPVPVAPETADLTRRALGYCAASGGRFDITMGTVTSLWDFHAGTVPSRRDIARALPHVGFRHIAVGEGEGGAPTLAIDDPRTVLDLGGIAKGYVADDLAGLLAGRGVTRFAINLGGNVLVRGGRPGGPGSRAGAPWRIGIVNPLDPAHSRAIVEVADGSVVTSGLHERRFTRGGITYHHILDPADGRPARTDLTSATIVAARSIDCDGWSTTALMAGSRAALDLIGGLPGIEAVLIDDADRVSWTDGVAERLSLVPTLPRL
ncbi:FAD:protein FMN transferase [Candidatus Collinsella stercoripullorum]|uniref:FAD:protein FMN transferase n=2 Tax=Candidatus Collinsella stercoripullorum TaxID=2838522 RepID=UPI0022E28AAA|nr:FAD:protein FMN transferase [Candidatus Collinsella stercoripullorum]